MIISIPSLFTLGHHHREALAGLDHHVVDSVNDIPKLVGSGVDAKVPTLIICHRSQIRQLAQMRRFKDVPVLLLANHDFDTKPYSKTADAKPNSNTLNIVGRLMEDQEQNPTAFLGFVMSSMRLTPVRLAAKPNLASETISP